MLIKINAYLIFIHSTTKNCEEFFFNFSTVIACKLEKIIADISVWLKNKLKQSKAQIGKGAKLKKEDR